ncbi:MAG: hypothetical protein QOF48_754 [Verrucomicrobiota bacterium]
MKPRIPKLQQTQHEEQILAEQNSNAQETAIEFASGDKAIRHDAANTPLPPSIAERLRQSIEREPVQPAAPWWKRWFGG